MLPAVHRNYIFAEIFPLAVLNLEIPESVLRPRKFFPCALDSSAKVRR